MVALLPPGVIQDGPGRFTHNFKSSQVYLGLVFAIVGVAAGIGVGINIAKQASPSPGLVVMACVFPVVFSAVFVLFCYKFRWSKTVIDFNSKQVRYVTTFFPAIMWTQPNKTVPLSQLSNMRIHDTGVRTSRRRGLPGTPVLEIRIDLGGDEYIPISVGTGYASVQPTLSQWTLWLQEKGVVVGNHDDASTLTLLSTGMMEGGGGANGFAVDGNDDTTTTMMMMMYASQRPTTQHQPMAMNVTKGREPYDNLNRPKQKSGVVDGYPECERPAPFGQPTVMIGGSIPVNGPSAVMMPGFTSYGNVQMQQPTPPNQYPPGSMNYAAYPV